jgi:hypothetical protein
MVPTELMGNDLVPSVRRLDIPVAGLERWPMPNISVTPNRSEHADRGARSGGKEQHLFQG